MGHKATTSLGPRVLDIPNPLTIDKIPAQREQAVHILDEYTDSDQRKANIAIHDLPESKQDT